MKEKIKSLSREAKAGIIIAIISILFFATVLIIRNNNNSQTVKISSTSTSSKVISSSTSSTPVVNPGDEDENPVVNLLNEKIVKPFTVEAEVFAPFFDKDLSPEELASAIIVYENQFYTNQGVDYNYNNVQFDVYAAFTGVVIAAEDDPIYGSIIKIQSQDGLIAVYQSLDSTNGITVGQQVNRGQKIAKSGNSIFGNEAGNHLHFALIRNGMPLNPEKFYYSAVKDVA